VDDRERVSKKNKQQKARIMLIMALSLTTMLIVAIVMLTISLANYGRDRRLYEQARLLAIQTMQPSFTPALPITIADKTLSLEPIEKPPIEVDFSTVREEGPNVLGWLYCKDTMINYPVVIYSDNTHYLTHDYTGWHSSSGALFFDFRLTSQLLGDNLIIYGHHMKDRSMFGSLLQYQKQLYYEAHPTMYLITPKNNYRIDLFAAWFTDSELENFPIQFDTEQKRRSFVQMAIANSMFTPNDESYYSDAKIISLVTCAYSDYIEDSRFLVQGWLVEIG
jgi:sortase B